MDQHINKLIEHLSERDSETTKLTGEDLMQQLWYYYLEENTADPEEIKEGFREVDALLKTPPMKCADRIFDVVCQQCGRYQRTAFLDGLALGSRLQEALCRRTP